MTDINTRKRPPKPTRPPQTATAWLVNSEGVATEHEFCGYREGFACATNGRGEAIPAWEVLFRCTVTGNIRKWGIE